MLTMLDKLVSRLDRWLKDRRVRIIKHTLSACGSDVSIDLPATIRGPDHVRIGSHVSINSFVHIWGQGGLVIGDDTLIASHTSITTLTHDPLAALFRESLIQRPVVIGKNVWIGTHATILPGVTIGDGAIVAAGAVVTHDVPSRVLVAGIPAKIIRTLGDPHDDARGTIHP